MRSASYRTRSRIDQSRFCRRQDARGLSLRGGGPHRIITDKCVIGFDSASRSAALLSLHEGASLEDVLANTGFPLFAAGQAIAYAAADRPTVALLREEIDPKGVYLGDDAVKARRNRAL